MTSYYVITQGKFTTILSKRYITKMLKLMFKSISAFIWFTISYTCNKNETCLEFLEGLEHHEIPEYRKDRKYLCTSDREESLSSDLQ